MVKWPGSEEPEHTVILYGFRAYGLLLAQLGFLIRK